MGPRRGGGKKGGTKGSKKRKNVWDDEREPDASTAADGKRGGARPKRGESMMGQWKKHKVTERNKRRDFEGFVAAKKSWQREHLDVERQRAADRVYEDKAARLEGLKAKKQQHQQQRQSKARAVVESDDESSDEEEKPVGKRQSSIFDQFVQTFQPAAADNEEEEEEEEEGSEGEYEEALVDEDGNEIVEDEEQSDDGEGDSEVSERDADQEEAPAVDEDDEEVEETEVDQTHAQDPYRQRFQLMSLTSRDVKAFDASPRKFVAATEAEKHDWPADYLVSFRPGLAGAEVTGETPLFIRERLLSAWKQKRIDTESLWDAGSMERALMTQLCAYRDVFFAGQTLANTPSLRRLSAMHVLNHVMKARDTVVRNNERLRKRANHETSEREEGTTEEEEEKEYRDQGFCRASVLVLLPLRSAAVAFVKLLMELLPPTVDTFHNKDRFFDEYGSASSEDDGEEAGHHDESGKEWQRVFAEGNNDDCFQVGLSFSRKAMRFYSEYHHADIILASPLGLRQQLGDEAAELDGAVDSGETIKLSTDILSSIEVCVVDSASLISMQNIDHLRTIMRAVNAQPKEAPTADFSRLREWNLAFLGSYFRQTVVFAHGVEPLLNALVNKLCRNVGGCVRFVRSYDAADGSASISHVVPRVKQIFQRIDTDRAGLGSLSAADEVELRFAYFKKHIFEPLLDHPKKHVLIFIPSYFDYVRVRNLFNDSMNRKLIRCMQCCEYTTSKQVSRARTAFFHGKCHVLLVTERFHFYHQYQLRGIHQLIWYGLPTIGDFYPEMLNMLPGAAGGADEDDEDASLDDDSDSKSSIALFTRLDLFRLQRVVGNKRAEHMCHPKAPKPTFLFC